MDPLDGVLRLGPDPLDLGLEAGHVGFELEHAPDPFEIEPGRRQVLDPPELLDVAL